MPATLSWVGDWPFNQCPRIVQHHVVNLHIIMSTCTTAALHVKGTASSVSALRLYLGKASQTTGSV